MVGYSYFCLNGERGLLGLEGRAKVERERLDNLKRRSMDGLGMEEGRRRRNGPRVVVNTSILSPSLNSYLK